MVRGGTAHCGVDTRTRAARGSSRGPSVRHARPAARSSRMSALGQFYGIGVGPGESGLISVAAITALRDVEPALRYRTFPGVTSFAATAAALSWPLGEGKERILILPCPDDPDAL